MTILEFNAIRLVALLGMALVACPSHAVLIDDFSDGAVSLRAEVTGPFVRDTQTGLNTDTVIDGEREISFFAFDLISGSTGAVTVDIDTELEQMRYGTTNLNISAADFSVWYGSVDEPLHADFTKEDRIRFEFESAALMRIDDYGLLDVTLIAQSDSTRIGRAIGSTTVRIPSSDKPFVIDVFFDQLPNFEHMNLSDVWAFIFGSGEANLPGSFVLSRVSTIPEPASVALLGMGVIALRLTLRLRC